MSTHTNCRQMHLELTWSLCVVFSVVNISGETINTEYYIIFHNNVRGEGQNNIVSNYTWSGYRSFSLFILSLPPAKHNIHRYNWKRKLGTSERLRSENTTDFIHQNMNPNKQNNRSTHLLTN